MSLMLKSLYAEMDGSRPPVIVDCGYMSEGRSKTAFDRLTAAGVGRRNFSVEGHGRLLCELPKRKCAALLAAFPIVEGGEYWRTTHRWEAPQPKEPQP